MTLTRPAAIGSAPEIGAHELGAPRPDDAGDSEDLARPDREADVGESALGARQPFDLDQRRRAGRRRDVREHAIERPADHLLDQRLDRHLGGLVGRDEAPVAQDEHAVRDAGDLVEAVADVDEADAFGLQPADLLEEPLGLFGAERGGRLVEYQEARVQRQRLGDLDLLLRGDAKVAHQRRRRSVESQAVQLLGRAPIHQLAINTAAPHRQAPDKDILGDRQVQQESHFLMNEPDSCRQRVGRRIGRIGLSAPGHGSGRRPNESGDDRGDAWTCRRRFRRATRSPRRAGRPG